MAVDGFIDQPQTRLRSPQGGLRRVVRSGYILKRQLGR
jgi:hypothetical protein